MRTKKLKSRLSRKVIRGGLFSFGAKNTTVFTCDSSEMCEGMDRVGKAITDEKSYPIQVSRGDRKNMYSYFEHSGSIDLLERVANTGSVNSPDVAKYKVILKILKSIFYSKGYYEEVEVLRKLEKKTTILPAEQTKIKEYIDRKNLSSILMSYEELYDKIIAMEQDLIARKEKITGRTEEQIQKEIDSKEKALIEKGFYLSAEDAEAANAAPAAVATATTAAAAPATVKAANAAAANAATANAAPANAATANAAAPATNPLTKALTA